MLFDLLFIFCGCVFDFLVGNFLIISTFSLKYEEESSSKSKKGRKKRAGDLKKRVVSGQGKEPTKETVMAFWLPFRGLWL